MQSYCYTKFDLNPSNSSPQTPIPSLLKSFNINSITQTKNLYVNLEVPPTSRQIPISCLQVLNPSFISLFVMLKLDPVNTSSLQAGPKVSFVSGGKWKDTAEGRGFSSWLVFFSLFAPLLPVECEGHTVVLTPREFQQPQCGQFSSDFHWCHNQRPSEVTHEVAPQQHSSRQLPNKFYQHRSQLYGKLYQSKCFSACQPQAAVLQQTSSSSVGYRTPLCWDLNLSLEEWKCFQICSFLGCSASSPRAVAAPYICYSCIL